jgi:hypothetical protein
MNPVLQTSFTAPSDDSQGRESRPANGRNDKRLCEGQPSLQRAVVTLRAIRQRYESDRDAHLAGRGYTVQVAVDSGDMSWITATIEALEKTIIGRALEPHEP